MANIYVALLRGINVGGKNRVEMIRLKAVFESLGFKNVRTYINSGNVVFSDSTQKTEALAAKIETAIEKEFEFKVPVVVRDSKNIAAVNKAASADWVNDGTMKTDVLFLWDDYDKSDVLDSLNIKSGIDDVTYVPGAVIWRVDRIDINKSGLLRIVGTDLYKHVTIRNINTLRKLASLMKEQ